jgi:hypothetical protein
MRELMLADPLVSAKAFTGRALVVSATRDAQVPKSDGDQLFAALGTKADRKERIVVAGANHAYKIESRDPKSLAPQEIAISYADDGHELAAGVVDAIAAFVVPR